MDKKRIQELKSSVIVRSVSILMLVSMAVLVCMEISSFYFTRIYEKNAIHNYQQSLELYCSYWDNKLRMINNSLVSVINGSGDDNSFWNISNTRDELILQTSKMVLVDELCKLASEQQNEMIFFCYYPEKNIFLKSSNNLLNMEKRKQLDDDIKKYIRDDKQYNSSKWTYLKSDEEEYFMNIYQLFDNYAGAIFKCDTILKEITEENSSVGAMFLEKTNGEVIHYYEKLNFSEQQKSMKFQIDMSYLGYDIHVLVMQKNLLADRRTFVFFSFATILVGIFLLAGNIVFQIKYVLVPVRKLKEAMEKFSCGDLKVRLREETSGNEITVLYHTFNEMAEQISRLKIEVYESQLAVEKMQADFLRVQIQPHFYTNILNLIYGLAQLRAYHDIQELSMTTAKYFRYLLGQKGTFVRLREEIECIESYFAIQKMRYEDYLEYSIIVDEELKETMVLPLVLQTFAGNAVKHNITLVPVLKIYIQITKKDTFVCMSVEDNGVGFDSDIMKKILRGEQISRDGEHIGIINVRERLKLFYGEQAEIHITSVRGCTKVEVQIPDIMENIEVEEGKTV